MLEANIREVPEFEMIVDIDHSPLAAKAGSSMRPSHILIWSDPVLEAAILKHGPLVAVDLPMRVLAFEVQGTRKAAVITNGYEYVADRHSLPDDETIRRRSTAAITLAMKSIPDSAIASFPVNSMTDAGLVILDSPFDFATTEVRKLDAINAESDVVIFGKVGFAARSKKLGITLEPMLLILFCAPGPGGKAMESAPTLGLDAFCQKLLIWQVAGGTVHVTFNDLLALANRQDVSGELPLHFINRRLKRTFSAALEK